MNDELDTLDFKVIKQIDYVLGMSSQVIRGGGKRRFVGKSASDVIGRNTAGFRAELKNQFAIKIGPCGIPMKKENGGFGALPFV